VYFAVQVLYTNANGDAFLLCEIILGTASMKWLDNSCQAFGTGLIVEL
jgi:hypothetical protein